MKLATEIFGDVIVVHAPDELGEDQASQFQAHVAGLDRSNVVLDFDGTELVDSKGLESLLRVQIELSEKGGDIRISTSNDINRKILEITRIDDRIEVYESVLDAVKSYS